MFSFMYLIAGDIEPAEAAPRMLWPTDSTRVTSEYGPRTINGVYQYHRGIDIGARSPGVAGDNIYAAHTGIVKNAYWNNARGWVVDIRHTGSYKVGGTDNVLSRYQHLRYSSKMTPGKTVYKGTVVGYMGASGDVTGVHLHFETMYCSDSTCNSASYVNPRTYLNDLGGGGPMINRTNMDFENTLSYFEEEDWYSYKELKNMTPAEREKIGYPNPEEEFE
ncbi:M23 family metallopeptidase [Ornithinibacillus xuwenensis]|uniref:M23 family metallopeptidase n=1 Tax=Ornithinibacillus xuwenensis TaxID=3144668 RepID=A0ABU9XIK2_9BACI